MWDVELARMFKDRDKKDKIGGCVGKVASVSPLKITIYNGDIVLEGEDLVLIDRLRGSFLEREDEVLLLPSEDEQTFFVIDRVRRAGG